MIFYVHNNIQLDRKVVFSIQTFTFCPFQHFNCAEHIRFLAVKKSSFQPKADDPTNFQGADWFKRAHKILTRLRALARLPDGDEVEL